MRSWPWIQAALALAVGTNALSGCSTPGATATGPGGAGGAGGPSSASSNPIASSSSGTGEGGAGGHMPKSCGALYSNFPNPSCDLLNQNCPAGQTCEPVQNPADLTWSIECNHATGLKGPAELCDQNSECQAGLLCANQCTPICCSADPNSCGGGACNLQFQFGANYVQVCAYSKSCHLLQPMACDPGYDCHIEDRTQGLAVCSKPSPTPVKEGQACTYLNDCADMQDCFLNVCRWYCALGQSGLTVGLGGCPTGEFCSNVVNATTVDFGVPGVGVCVSSG